MKSEFILIKVVGKGKIYLKWLSKITIGFKL